MSNLEIMKDLYAAIGQGRGGTVLAALDPNIEWREAEGNPYQPSGEAWIGPDVVAANLAARVASEWDGHTTTPTKFHDAGDTVVVEARCRGTYKATGKVMDAQACHIWGLRDGKVVTFQQFVDTAQLQKVMDYRG
jgi:ketosteroid isomerase-like protein